MESWSPNWLPEALAAVAAGSGALITIVKLRRERWVVRVIFSDRSEVWTCHSWQSVVEAQDALNVWAEEQGLRVSFSV